MPPTLPLSLFDPFTVFDTWICNSLVPKYDGLTSTLKVNASAQLDEIVVAPSQGKLLYLFPKMNNVKRCLQVGTLGGYSALWVGQALPSSGKIITLELEPEHAKVASSNSGMLTLGT